MFIFYSLVNYPIDFFSVVYKRLHFFYYFVNNQSIRWICKRDDFFCPLVGHEEILQINDFLFIMME